jgi:predicted NBD/HSP70 family sugar kinase
MAIGESGVLMPAPVSGIASAGRILDLIRSGRVRTRRELLDHTGLSRSTLSLRMAQLLAAGYIQEIGQVAGNSGRPAKILSFDETGHLVLAVDLGATAAQLALMDAGGTVVMESSHDIRIDSSPEDVIRMLAKRLGELLARSGRPFDRVVGVGVGVPGPVFPTTGRPNQPPMMPGWHNYPVAERLSEAMGIPVFVDNDANLMGLGEARERHSAAPSVLFVMVGTGIGAGVILHGQPERGIAGGAGNIGHIRVVEADQGLVCTCGATGCLATVASGGAVARQLTEQGIPAVSGRDVARVVAAGSPVALGLVRDAGRELGIVLATSVALLNPAVLVLGGDLASPDGELVEAVREAILERTVPLARRELIITASQLGTNAALQGARHLVIDQTFAPDAVDARLEQQARKDAAS